MSLIDLSMKSWVFFKKNSERLIWIENLLTIEIHDVLNHPAVLPHLWEVVLLPSASVEVLQVYLLLILFRVDEDIVYLLDMLLLGFAVWIM